MMNFINALLNHAPMEKKGEFAIGDTVTLDRYNHIDDVEVVKIIDIQPSWGPGGGIEYIMDVKGVKIRSNGKSIMESKHYEPCPEEDRHYRKNATVLEIEDFWDKKRGHNTLKKKIKIN
jgi:hypothetical protein